MAGLGAFRLVHTRSKDLKNFNLLSKTINKCARAIFGTDLNAKGFTTTPFPEFKDLPNIKTHDDLYKFSLEDPEKFWSILARSRLDWYKDFGEIRDCNLGQGKIRWFLGGKLNASVNCVDRHLTDKGNSIALIWEKDEPGTQEYVTYNNGIKRGDRVAIYLPQSPIAVSAMLACTRIGAIHSVVFAGFSSEALAGRIQDAKAETVITADQGIRGGKYIHLKKTVDDAVSQCPSVKRVFVYKRTGNNVPMHKIDIPLEKEMEGQSDKCPPEEMESEDYLFMLYTSGSTGKPKGIAHSTAGYLLYTSVTYKHVFDYQPGEIFGCMADIGWITGHSYVVYGPLSNGATTLLFESTPVYPNPVKYHMIKSLSCPHFGRYWETTERLQLNHMYLAPTALRMLIKVGDSWVKKYDRSSLRKLGCVLTIFFTETGGICITPRPSEVGAVIKPAMPMRPFFGIEPIITDATGQELKGNGVKGALCLSHCWPGIARTIFGDHERYVDTYLTKFPGLYNTGDGALRTKDGFYQITGRMDDVLNVSGHRLGTAEIEDALDDHPDVAESAVVGFPHDIKGEGIYAYVVLKDGVTRSEEELSKELLSSVKTKISAFAQPETIMELKIMSPLKPEKTENNVSI
ncbi:hypothetical protein KUTeg_001253 [Tegillarca granosa]|uniref:acetate--CoA ligase n=1 Tax=Tegillarca granosa TaxID=220873 RepID=A0ABQ9FZR0_TEGGR|nr:hypothetical protein KUTeg_001253 [Tegillarca granosa]